ncbi:MAG: hypothetical protein AAGM46_26960 [Cyanobacteria bacterium J06582_2]
MNKRFEMNMELEKIKDEKVESYCIKGATDNSGSDSEQNESELEEEEECESTRNFCLWGCS